MRTHFQRMHLLYVRRSNSALYRLQPVTPSAIAFSLVAQQVLVHIHSRLLLGFRAVHVHAVLPPRGRGAQNSLEADPDDRTIETIEASTSRVHALPPLESKGALLGRRNSGVLERRGCDASCRLHFRCPPHPCCRLLADRHCSLAKLFFLLVLHYGANCKLS